MKQALQFYPFEDLNVSARPGVDAPYFRYSMLHYLIDREFGGKVLDDLARRYLLTPSTIVTDEILLWRCTRYCQPVGARIVRYDFDRSELAMLDTSDDKCDFKDFYIRGAAWFGGHLFREAGDIIAVCTDEYECLRIAAREPGLTVMATSPCQALTADLMQQYCTGKRVILFAEDDEIERWRAVATTVRGIMVNITRLNDYENR